MNRVMCVRPDAGRRGVHRCKRHTEAGGRRTPYRHWGASPSCLLVASCGSEAYVGNRGLGFASTAVVSVMDVAFILRALYEVSHSRVMRAGVGTLGVRLHMPCLAPP